MRIASVSGYAIFALALVLSACATKPTKEEDALKKSMVHDITPQARQARDTIARQDVLTQAAFWAREYDNNPADHEAALKLAQIVRVLGKPERAAEVASQALTLYPKDPALLLVAGQALVETAKGANAIAFLQSAALLTPTDWHVHTALGVAYDQIGKPMKARAAFNKALSLAPGNAGILSNLGLNYATAGDTAMAERYLRQAVARPDAPVQARQNLALVLALQGRFDEADALATEDLPKAQARKNIDYVRAMVVRPNRWETLKNDK